MLQEAAELRRALEPIVAKIVNEKMQNALRAERFEVSTEADGTVMGVRQPYGKEIFLPYTQAVANAQEGEAVLVLWRGTLSNGKVWCYGNGPE